MKKQVAIASLIILGFVGVILMSGCFQAKRIREVKQTKDEYEIVNIDHANNFCIDLKNLRTGQTHKNVHVSNSNEVSLGMKVSITNTLWEYNDGSQEWSFNPNEIKEAFEKLKQ